jgi:Zn-dependent protease
VLLPALLLLAPLALGTRPFVFGWAKPVPIDPQRFHSPRRDTVLVALAGPGTNLLLAAVSTLVLALLPAGADPMSLIGAVAFMCRASIQFNCVLAVFNLVPIPPLDGGRVLMALLPRRAARAVLPLEGIGYVVVLLVVLNTGVLGTLVRPLMMFFLGLAR